MSVEAHPNFERIIVGLSSFNAGAYIDGLQRLPSDLVEQCAGVKTPRSLNVSIDPDEHTAHRFGVLDLATLAVGNGAQTWFCDARFGSQGHELVADVDDLLDDLSRQQMKAELEKVKRDAFHYENEPAKRNRALERAHDLSDILARETTVGIFPPKHISVVVSGDTDIDELTIAAKDARKNGTELVAVVGNSKKSRRSYEQDGFGPDYTVKLCRIALSSGVRHLMIAAIDAPQLRDELDADYDQGSFEFIATGAFTDVYDQSDHDRPVLIENTVGINKYMLGAAVLLADNPSQSLRDHADAMPSLDL